MMSRGALELIANGIANNQFNKWCEELGKVVDEAMNNALNMDNRLSDKTRQKIFNNFITQIETFKRKVS